MISHLIIKHKPRITVHSSVNNSVNSDWYNNPANKNWQNYRNEQSRQTPISDVVSNIGHQLYHLGKMQYAEMLKKLRLKKGDYCVHRAAPYPYSDDAIYKVFDIIECHWLDNNNKLPFKEPRPYIIKNKKGEMLYANDDMVFNYLAPNDRAW